MNNSSCLHCGAPIESSGRGQPRKFCSEAHKKAFQRNPKPASPQKTPITESPTITPEPTNPQQDGPTREQLLTNCWDHLPPHIAAYMPVQPENNVQDMLAFERRIHSKTPSDKDCKF